MIKFIISGLIVAFTFKLSCQNIHIGYPNDTIIAKSSDVIILSMPTHKDGRFCESKNLDSLVAFLDNKKELTFTIEINISLIYGLKEANFVYSNNLLSSLSSFLKAYSRNNNYILISKGSNDPIYPIKIRKKHSLKDKLKYNKQNTYLRLVVMST